MILMQRMYHSVFVLRFPMQDESAVLFVIDTSGSMCVTTAVEGKLSLRGDRTKDMSRLLAAGVSSCLICCVTA